MENQYAFITKIVIFGNQNGTGQAKKTVDANSMTFISVYLNDDKDNGDFDMHYQFYLEQRR